MEKLVVMALPAGKQTFLVETAAAPDFLANVLQHESTPLQSALLTHTAPSSILPTGLATGLATAVTFGQATVGKPFPSSRLSAVIPGTTGMEKLMVIALSAGKHTFLVETAASPDFLAKVLQHEPTFLQSDVSAQTDPSSIVASGLSPHAYLPYSLQITPFSPY